VGDSPYDIQSGNAAGVATIAALWGPFGRDALAAAAPTHFLERIGELPRLVEER
jgi:pyrophosphatase PpaX